MSTHTIGKTGVALAVGALMLAAAPPARAQQGVTVQLFQFKPGQIEVKAGTRLTWTNQDDITHTVTSGTPEQRDGRFELPLDGRGATGIVQLEEPGTYPYFCSRHQSMRGEIRVR
jgi:plastocyanin